MELETIDNQNVFHEFSKEHHLGRSLSWNIQQGIKLGVSPEKMWVYVNWFWENNLASHFHIEEQKLFSILDRDNQFLKKAQSQHRRLKRLFEKSPKDIKTLNSIEEELNRLIRFEESILYSEILKKISEEELFRITKSIPSVTLKEWEGEQFWKTKQV
ncbi:MAG: hemerythrin domain-containing protein [Crocinitomicaceae bacterium]|nr:hemerythrin domain-containing protein [Crocinitomicaceae bacterium]